MAHSTAAPVTLECGGLGIKLRSADLGLLGMKFKFAPPSSILSEPHLHFSCANTYVGIALVSPQWSADCETLNVTRSICALFAKNKIRTPWTATQLSEAATLRNRLGAKSAPNILRSLGALILHTWLLGLTDKLSNECKRRKLKCSGEPVCSRCARDNVRCVYTANAHAVANTASPSVEDPVNDER